MNRIMQEIAAAALCGATTAEEGTLERTYLFPQQFAGFQGHFPEHPILPAIVEILTVVSLVSEQMGSRQRLSAVEDAKFLTPVRPEQELLVKCRPKLVKGKQLWDAQLSVAGVTTATMLLDLVEASA
jgi:3-hydroxyacyl-[acyl-carrier-protein] dehydratase